MTHNMRQHLWRICFDALITPDITLAQLSDLYCQVGYRVSLSVTRRVVLGVLCPSTPTPCSKPGR